jgi:L-2,4-diaminobutyrate decarboxylase
VSGGLDALLGDATPAGRAARRAALLAAADCLDEIARARTGPYSGASPEELAGLVAGLDLLPEEGAGLPAALGGLGMLVLRHAVDSAHPAAAAHLHCAPLHAALAGELVAAAGNASLDSWDQAPVATHLEQRLVRTLAAEAGYHPDAADGVLTSGGTQSNLMGLLLARDAAGRRLGRDLAAEGLGSPAARWRVLCSEAAHFSVRRAASLLGLGHQAVVAVATDPGGRMAPAALDQAIERLRSRDLEPIALVATAGTTDLGAIDPLTALAERAARQGLWLHVDAAVGGALLFSRRHRARLDGWPPPTPSPSTSTSCCGSRWSAGCSWSATAAPSARWTSRWPTSTPPRTRSVTRRPGACRTWSASRWRPAGASTRSRCC